MNVLMISKDRSHRLVYAGALSGYGLDVVETPSFEEACAVLNSGAQPDTIVIDLKLSALEASDFIRYAHQHGAEHIVVIGGNDRDEKAVEQVGASTFLYRPVDLNTLVRTVA